MTNQAQSLKERYKEPPPEKLLAAEFLRTKGNFEGALKEVGSYLNEHLTDVPALLIASQIFTEQKLTGLSYPFLKLASQLMPEEAGIWNDLGMCYQENADLLEGEMLFHKALKLEPNAAIVHTNLAQNYLNQGQPHLCIKHSTRAIALNPSDAIAYYNRALANLMLGNYEEGWADYDSVLGVGDIRKERVYGIVPKWNGTEGKQLIAFGEQGIGDEISFASCIPDLMKQNKVVIECDPRLHGLFLRSFGLETHGTRYQQGVGWLFDKDAGKPRKFDGAVAFGSLPQFYRNKESDFPGTPYLVPDPERRIMWRALLDSLGPKPKIGITWTGGNPNTGKLRRSLELVDLMPILRQDATFVNLQYKPAKKELGELERSYGIRVHDFPYATLTKDYDDTAALVAELDLVISVTTAVVHLCGAIGQTCWAMAPKTPRWFYRLDGETIPWYKSVKLYRQKKEWVFTIAEIAHDLREWIKANG